MLRIVVFWAAFSLTTFSSLAQCSEGFSSLVVEVFTDNYPGEITWTIQDSSGIVLEGGPYSTVSQLYASQICVPSGLDFPCLTFNINDSYGDGICCAYGEGYYTIALDGEILAMGGEYGSSEDFVFECTPPSSVETVEGCTVASACNYNPEANTDDGSCEYFSCAALGCTDASACNYNPAANTDDGSCEYFSCAALGCTDSEACNFEVNAEFEDGSCEYPDALGVCGGDCQEDINGNGICDTEEIAGCTDPEACNYDAEANLDNGTCLDDLDGDNICDDEDSCVGVLDDCGICNGPGAVFSCGCTEMAQGDCDCEGNQLDALGVCGGSCGTDQDMDGICDDEDDCVGNLDACGVCNGPGEVYSCGCADLLEGDCDCDGNQLDALGICGGDCLADANANGVCDDQEVPGCNAADALNFNPDATEDDGSCVFELDLPASWSHESTPSSGVFLGHVTVEGETFPGPKAVGAFSSSGACVGWALTTPSEGLDYISLTIYGDDPTTPAVDGMVFGEGFTLAMHLFNQDTTITHQEAGSLVVLQGWSNTNGAPLPQYSNPATAYDFSLSTDCDVAFACNYNPGSIGDADCAYAEDGYDCEGVCLLDDDGDGICNALEILGCTDPVSCNYDDVATEDDGSCADLDECGVCGGVGIEEGECDCDGNVTDALGVCGGDCVSDEDNDGVCDDIDPCVGAVDECGVCNGAGAVYDCGCSDLPAGDCDCEGNQFDALGVCGGDCLEDLDEDGVCDNVDACVGAFDVCGVCNGPGAVYECGCSDIPEGDCDCDGNELDAVGNCGGSCTEDADMDGVCDDVDNCVGDYDACGVCNGPGEVYACGCTTLPEGSCDCEGNVLDAVGVCGGACAADLDQDGVCDDIDACVGFLDNCGVCNGPGAIYECGCADIPEGNCDCNGNELDALGICGGGCAEDLDGDGICDDEDPCVGALDAIGVCNGACTVDADADGVCDDEEVFGCDDLDAVNYAPEATENDGSCNYEDLLAPEGFAFTPGPSSSTILGLVTLDGAPCTGMDWVGAFAVGGACAGSANLTVFQGQSYLTLAVYSDDLSTPDVVEGLGVTGEFSLRLYDHSSGTTVAYNAGQVFQGWVNTNGGLLPGFSNPETVYAFTTTDCPDNDGDGLCNDEDPCPNGVVDALGNCQGNCTSDFNSNGVCDNLEVFGCTYVDALNYNSAATTDNGSCLYENNDNETVWATCYGDLNGNGTVGIGDLIEFLAVYGTSCN